MTLKPDRRAIGILIALVFGLVLSMIPSSAMAAPAQLANSNGDTGLRVDGALVNVILSPGQTYVHHMLVSSGSQAADMEINVEGRGFGETQDGSFLALPADQDASPFSGRKLIVSILPAHFHLAPGGSVPVDVSINLPAGSNADSLYATLLVYNQDAGADTKIGFQTSLLIPVVITSRGAVFTRTGAVTDLQLSPLETGKPVEVKFTLRNTGNRHYKTEGQAILRDRDGQIVTSIPVPLSDTSILPTFTRIIKVTSVPLTQTESGPYSIGLSLTTEDGKALVAGTIPTSTPTQLSATLTPTVSESHRNNQKATATFAGGGKMAISRKMTSTFLLVNQETTETLVLEPAINSPTSLTSLLTTSSPLAYVGSSQNNPVSPVQTMSDLDPSMIAIVIGLIGGEVLFLFVFVAVKRERRSGMIR